MNSANVINSKLNCKVSDIFYYLPETILNNETLSERYEGWTEAKIYEKTGINTRHVVSENEHVSDLAANAAKLLFENSNVKSEEIDALIICTQTPDYSLPATSSLVHKSLGLPAKCLTFDFNQGCTGFVYGLAIAGSMIHSGLVKNVLLITAETYSRWCHPMDKSVSTIFGDGAAAIHLCSSDIGLGLGPFLFGTDGSGFYNLIVPSSGSHRLEESENANNECIDGSGNIRTPSNLYMNGPELFRFAISAVPDVVNDILKKSEKSHSDIDKYVFHQANQYMLKMIQKKLDIPNDKMIIEIDETGNTVSSSIPIAIKRAYEKGSISFGDQLLVVGFGVGYSWGGTLFKWEPGVIN